MQGKGQEFLNEYYSYVEKIYNYQIPLRDIATKGKVKKTLAEYKKDVQTLTKAGRPKSRQAWYELAIANNLTVGNGDTIYYINTGKSKSHADVKKTKKYYTTDMFGEQQDVTKEIESKYNKWKKTPESIESAGGTDRAKTYSIDYYAKKLYPDIRITDEIILNCALVPRDILDKEEDTFCADVSEDLEYNVPKYVDMFNKRITPLLVCFSKEIRSDILIDNPNNRPYFTEEQCELVSGEPNKPGDQDTYEQLMTMEDKEIRFWKKYNLVPPFVEECGMGTWEEILADYDRRMEEEERTGLAAEKALYGQLLEQMTAEEIDEVIEEGALPAAFSKIVEVDPETMDLISKAYNHGVIGNLRDFIDAREAISQVESME